MRYYTDKNGYRQHYNPKSPDARKSGYSPVHRDVARYKYQREIKTWEVVHHKDGNKQNNSRDNLILMSRSQHTKMHNRQRQAAKAGCGTTLAIVGSIICIVILFII